MKSSSGDSGDIQTPSIFQASIEMDIQSAKLESIRDKDEAQKTCRFWRIPLPNAALEEGQSYPTNDIE